MIQYIIEKNLLPDWLIRAGITLISKQRLCEQANGNKLENFSKFTFIESVKNSPIALVPEKANEQHYEVPARFFELCLGKRKKYSSCYYTDNTQSLDEAEENMLSLYVKRGEFQSGQNILELGCGWGSLTLYLAEKFPQSEITGVSNSGSQKEYILSKAKELNLSNIKIVTCDMNVFEPQSQYDRIVSIEMFEHMRNWEKLFQKVSAWLKNDGKFFMHVFTHKEYAYPYEVKDSTDWMAKYFFSGGMMPSDDMPLYFQKDLILDNHWTLSGVHYGKTARHWLENLDKNKDEALKLLATIYGKGSEIIWFVRWRLFYMACEVMFGYKNGSEWKVSHYLFCKR